MQSSKNDANAKANANAMTKVLQKWEKDPVFFAADQVQDSADRLDSAFRAWMRAKTLPPEDAHRFYGEAAVLEFCRRELATAFGIAAGLLAEFEKEVSSYTPEALDQDDQDDRSKRHADFISAISNQIMSVKNALRTSTDTRDLSVLPSVSCLGQPDTDQLALFLSGTGAGERLSNMQSRGPYSPPHTKVICWASTIHSTEGSAILASDLLGLQSASQDQNVDLSRSRPHETCKPIDDPRVAAIDGCKSRCLSTLALDSQFSGTKINPSSPKFLATFGSNDKDTKTGTDLKYFSIAIIDENKDICSASEAVLMDCYGSDGRRIKKANSKSQRSLVRQIFNRATSASMLLAGFWLFLQYTVS